MFNNKYLMDWFDCELKEIIENEILYNEDVDCILYDDDWELLKEEDYPGGEIK